MKYETFNTQPLDERFGTVSEGFGLCPLMSQQGAPCYCTRECAYMGASKCKILSNQPLEILHKLLKDL